LSGYITRMNNAPPFPTLLPPRSKGFCFAKTLFRSPHSFSASAGGIAALPGQEKHASACLFGRPLPPASSGFALRWLPAPPLLFRPQPGGNPLARGRRCLDRKNTLPRAFAGRPLASKVFVSQKRFSAPPTPFRPQPGRSPRYLDRKNTLPRE
jgi:hypothetical protein